MIKIPFLWCFGCENDEFDQCRSYKNGFVWHDLSHDDLVLPANGDEYVLKGSELLDQPSSGNPKIV